MTTIAAGKPQALLTADEFMAMPGSRDFELVDGVLVERKLMGARASHIASMLSYFLNGYCLSHPGAGWVFDSEATYQCFGRPRTVRRPDVSFIRSGRLPGEELPEGYITIAPDLAVEVISPTNTGDDIEVKVLEYLAAKTTLVWVVFPTARTIHVRRPDGSSAVMTERDTLAGDPVLPGFACPVRDLFPPPPAQEPGKA